MPTSKELREKERRVHEQYLRQRNAERKQARSQRNHALAVIGGLVVAQAKDKDWTTINFDRLSAWVSKYGYKIAECCTEPGTAGDGDTTEAYRKLKDWEKKNRSSSSSSNSSSATVSVPEEEKQQINQNNNIYF